ncbi:Uncharacterised protein [Shigella sonnei]|nr:Uncharacterised protein [Shigella sonnei]
MSESFHVSAFAFENASFGLGLIQQLLQRGAAVLCRQRGIFGTQGVIRLNGHIFRQINSAASWCAFCGFQFCRQAGNLRFQGVVRIRTGFDPGKGRQRRRAQFRCKFVTVSHGQTERRQQLA